MAIIYLGLGSNIEPVRHLRLGLAELERRFVALETSCAYLNAPVGFEGADFVNLVAKAETRMPPEEVVRTLEEIHVLAGRTQRAGVASRELDIDLLLYDSLVLARGGDIELPRRDVLAYDFVLRPLSELAPDYVHPETGRRLADHWAESAPTARPMTRAALDR